MAVLYRPITSKVKDLYNIEEYKGTNEYSEVLKYMPLDIAFGSMVFFYHLHNDCVTNLMDYIQNEVEQWVELNKLLVRNGVGINQFTQQVKETFSTLIPLPNYQ